MYTYKAIDAHGRSIKGIQEAASPLDLELHLKRSGLDLVSARTQIGTFGGMKIKRQDLITFFFNLDQLTRAGVPLLECLNDLHDSMDTPAFRNVIAKLLESIGNGLQLSQAMAQHPRAFDNVTLRLIHAGEESGKLPDVFRHLSESLKWQDEIAAQTRNMMLYPLFVCAAVIVVTIFLMTYFVPQLVGFIKSTGHELPLQTRALLAVSSVFVQYWPLILGAPFVLFGVYRSALRIDPGLQYHIDNLQLHIWPTGPVLRKIILARFAHAFAMMYSSGVGIIECISNSRTIVNNQVVSKSLQQIITSIDAGNNLTQSFEDSKMFPPLVVRMFKVGESTGQLDEALLNVSYFYERDIKDAIRKLQIMIEPSMTIILGAILGWVMLSVLSPIYDIISGMKM